VMRFRTIEGLILPIFFLLAWETGARLGLVPAYLSAPSSIAREFERQLADAEYYQNISASLLRAYAGFALGSAVGIGVGLAAGLYTPVRNFFEPLVSFLYPVPKIVFLPVFLLLFGLGHGSQIAPIFLTTFFPVFIAARDSVASLNPNYVWAGLNMGATAPTVFRRIIFPGALPQLFIGLRVGLAHSFVVLFAAELIGARSGLGFFIIDAENAVRFDRMMVGIATFGILGFFSDRLLMTVRKRALRGQLIGTTEQAQP
jgi:ABC-type nitrate/sulfonate/bicarbonate transport system permease component